MSENKNKSVPKMIYTQPSIKDFIKSEYPQFKPFISDEYIEEETVFIISDTDSNYVTKKGILYLNPDSLTYMSDILFNFFKSRQDGVPLKEAFESLISNLVRRSNEHREQYH